MFLPGIYQLLFSICFYLPLFVPISATPGYFICKKLEKGFQLKV